MKNPFLVYQAKSFYNAYIALEQVQADEDELLYFTPRLVNGAFSIELTIKAILTEQGFSYGNEHNLKILFELLPLDIQNQIWRYLEGKAPEYADSAKRENELLLMSEAFVQWRYCYEGKPVPAFDARFLSAFANSVIYIMFSLGYNAYSTKVEKKITAKEYAEIDRKFESNRNDCAKTNQDKIDEKRKREVKADETAI